ncbi:hypothetical protein [Sulfurimonas sp.]|uniref:hypothetical protein n=1 Tax=Sulfurimonas sp. TaxID=2022749 RepID=UPI001A0926A0|nr:hypothetical protein [Sulfurimonas sp.]MBE0515733.1 hypothetical protein [Sulfurimonas sp.]
MKKIIFSLVVIGIISLSANDTVVYDCARPLKPSSLQDSRDVQRYNSAVDNYKTCVDTFLVKRKEAISAERENISKAIEDWNGFVAEANKKTESQKFTGSTGVPLGGSHTVGKSDSSKITTGFKF